MRIEEHELKYIPCPLIRWDFYVDGSERSLILSLCSPHEKVVAQTIMNEDTATALRDAINELLRTDRTSEEERMRITGISVEREVVRMQITISVDLKIVNVYYTRVARIQKSAPVPSAPFMVNIIDETRFERFTSNIDSRFEVERLERWFSNYNDAREYAKQLLDEFKEETLKMLERQHIPSSAIKVFFHR